MPSLRPSRGAALALLLGSGLTALAACGGAPAKDVASMTPAELYLANCARCHGRAGEGSFLAPTLDGIAANWDVDRLQRYLRDPDAIIAEDERLIAQGRKYAQRMPAFPHIAPAQREALAAWLLGGRQ